MLFIKGILRTNMAYTMPDCVDEDSFVGQLMHMSVDCPFEHATELEYNMCQPSEMEPKLTIRGTMKNKCYPCHRGLNDENYMINMDRFNWPMVAELMDAKIMSTTRPDEDLSSEVLACNLGELGKANLGRAERDACTMREDLVMALEVAIYQNKFVQMS